MKQGWSLFLEGIPPIPLGHAFSLMSPYQNNPCFSLVLMEMSGKKSRFLIGSSTFEFCDPILGSTRMHITHWVTPSSCMRPTLSTSARTLVWQNVPCSLQPTCTIPSCPIAPGINSPSPCVEPVSKSNWTCLSSTRPGVVPTHPTNGP